MIDFIGQYNIDEKICDELIEFHKNSQDKRQLLQVLMVQHDVKMSTDVTFEKEKNDLAIRYEQELQKCLNWYMDMYRYSTIEHQHFTICETMNIQHYKQGEGYPAWHYENRKQSYSMKRHLVFMTYLNTVDDEGETEFWYQRKYIQHKKRSNINPTAAGGHTLIEAYHKRKTNILLQVGILMWIKDNFLDDVDYVRQLALGQNYRTIDTNGKSYYKGHRADVHDEIYNEVAPKILEELKLDDKE